jgi:hypothetical protein
MKLCNMVWVLVGVLRLLVGLVISLDSCLEPYNIVCNGQNETGIGLVNIWT